MKHLTKLGIASTALATAFVVTPAIHSTVDAAETSISQLVYSNDGTEFTVSYEEFTNALFDGSGDLYNFIVNEQPSIKAVGLESGTFVKYEVFATAVFDDTEGQGPLEILAELSGESSNTVSDSEVSSYQTLQGFNDGDPVFEDAETPEVISID